MRLVRVQERRDESFRKQARIRRIDKLMTVDVLWWLVLTKGKLPFDYDERVLLFYKKE